MDDDYPIGPQVLPSPPDPGVVNAREYMESVRGHIGDRGSAWSPYVPSGRAHPCFLTMGQGQREFYLCWRDAVLDGRFGDTDMGYLRLFLSEILVMGMDAQEAMGILEGMLFAYGDSSEEAGAVLRTVCLDHALLNGLDPPCDCNPGDMSVMVIAKLSSVPPGHFTTGLASAISGGRFDRYMDRSVDYEGPLNAALNAVPVDPGTGRAVRSRVRIMFAGVVQDSYVMGKISDGSISPRSVNVRPVDDALRAAVNVVNRRHGLRRVPGRPIGPEDSYLRMEAAAEAFLDVEEAEARRRRSRAPLDPAAVSRAERDLEAVRELVGVEEVQEEVQVSVPVRPAAFGWDALQSLLGPIQRGYLEACLSGTSSAFLRSNGLRMRSVEDSINALSMDAVGDQIVEDGKVVEEYLGEVSCMAGYPS